MKRIATYVLAALLGGAAGYFLAPRCPQVLAELETCEGRLRVEQEATDLIAKQADQRCQTTCDARVDQMLAERKPCP